MSELPCRSAFWVRMAVKFSVPPRSGARAGNCTAGTIGTVALSVLTWPYAPKTRSFPAPEEMRSAPAPPRTMSLPAPSVIESLPSVLDWILVTSRSWNGWAAKGALAS